MMPIYTDVRLVKPYERNGLLIPRGAIGTIVDVYPEFSSYTVDFAEPYECAETVPMALVEFYKADNT